MQHTFARLALVGALFFSLAAPNSGRAQTRELSTRGNLIDRVAAIVNDGAVLQSELDVEIERIVQRLRERKTELPPASVLRKQVLERLVLQEIQRQRANKLGLHVSDEMLNGALEDIAQRNNVTFNQLPETLRRQGIDYREFREEVRRDLTLQLLRQRDVISRINISPRELEQFLARQQKMPDQTSEYNLSHILIAVPQAATSEQAAQREARAKEVLDKYKAGADFAQLAVSYSDSGTNVDGGSLGWRKGPELPTIAAEYIPKLKAGEVTEAIRTPSGFHIFRLNEVRGGAPQSVVAQAHARHILLRTNDLEDDSTVKQRLEKIRERILVGHEDFGAIASVTSADTASATEGGDLGWTGPGAFAPEFEKQLDALKENEITPPFKTQFGWHIAQLLGRRLHDATDDVRRNRAFAALRDAKAEEETELWLRRLRNDAFVEFRL